MVPSAHFEHLRANAARLDRALSRCAEHPGNGPVHHLRTGTRRVEAALESGLGEAQGKRGATSLRKAASRLNKLLHKMRHRAGVVRDADVHLQMLRRLRQQALATLRESSHEAHRNREFVHECRALEAALANRRAGSAAKLRHRAAKWQKKLDKRLEALVQADLPPSREERADIGRRSAGEIALASFVEVCERTPELNASTLHGFRKGTKRARYQAETGEDDDSRRIAAQLKEVQDAIGIWHDWLALAEEAGELATNHPSTGLLQHQLEVRREREFHKALRTTQRWKKRLLASASRRLAAPEQYRHPAA